MNCLSTLCCFIYFMSFFSHFVYNGLKEVITLNKPLDHRVRITRTLLKEALFRLIKSKKLHEITIKDLCSEAKINRSTFYAHYQSISDLINQLELEALDDLMLIFKKSAYNPMYFASEIYVDVFKLAKENRELFELVLIENADPNFLEKVYRLGEGVFTKIYEPTFSTKEKKHLQYYYISVLNSFVGILRKWLQNGLRESIEDISEIAKKIITRGIHYLLDSKYTSSV